MNEFMELTGRELDRAVAEALGWTDFSVDSRGLLWGRYPGDPEDETRLSVCRFSTSWGACEEILRYLDECETTNGSIVTWNLSTWWDRHERPKPPELRFMFRVDDLHGMRLGGCGTLGNRNEAICRAFLQVAPKLRRKTG